ncbi:MAG: hypothetical protein ACRDJP_07975 [Actinomycetota bacterium]
MTHVGYVAAGWIAVVLVIAVYAAWVLVKGRQLAQRFDRDDLPWG